eukprot:5933031-Pleurochrysis_carterae.AAC.2
MQLGKHEGRMIQAQSVKRRARIRLDQRYDWLQLVLGRVQNIVSLLGKRHALSLELLRFFENTEALY